MRIARILSSAGPTHAVFRNGLWEHIVDPFAETLSRTGEATMEAEAVYLAPVTRVRGNRYRPQPYAQQPSPTDSGVA